MQLEEYQSKIDVFNLVTEIDIKDIIDRETFCNRKWFSETHINNLADSISKIGIQNPIIVRKHPTKDGFQLISGENRLRALELNKQEKVSVKIVNFSDEKAEHWSFESNLFHEQGHLNPVEQGYFYRKLKERGLTQENIAKKFNIAQSTVGRYISLTKLSPKLQEIFIQNNNKFTIKDALILVKLAKYDDIFQLEVWNEYGAIRDPRKRTSEELERFTNRKIRNIELERDRLKELEDILEMYWNQDSQIISDLRSKFQRLGYNNDQIKGEVLRFNEQNQILINFEQNEDFDQDFYNELKLWINKANPTNNTIRKKIKDFLEEKQSILKSATPKITQLIHIKNSEKMGEIPDNSVHLIITSPPYWDLKDYGTKNQIGFKDSFEEYIQRLCAVFEECIRVLLPSGRLCINVGDVFISTKKFGRYKVWPIHSRLISFCEANGVDYTNTIFWKKIGKSTGGGGIKGGIFGSYPYPPNGIINNDIEYIITFKKPGKRDRPPPDILVLHEFNKFEWMRHHSQIWDDIQPVSQRKGHPAVFPDELPRRLIRMFSFQGEVVLDPFLGTGTTCKVSKEMERNSIGYEINPAFVSLVKQKCPNAKIIDEKGEIIQNYS